MTKNHDFPKKLQNCGENPQWRARSPTRVFWRGSVAGSYHQAVKRRWGVLPAVLERFRKIVIYGHFY